MENHSPTEKRNWIYAVAAIYVVLAYSFIFLGSAIHSSSLDDYAPYLYEFLDGISFFLPFIWGMINLAVMLVVGRTTDRNQLLDCAVLVKYGLIPFYIIGSILVFVLILFTFIPVPFMIFAGPIGAAGLTTIGYGILLGGAPFSIAYLVRCKEDGVHRKGSLILAGIAQFFLVFDVAAVMVLAVREQRWKKLTTAVVILLAVVLALLVIGLFTTVSSIAL